MLQVINSETGKKVLELKTATEKRKEVNESIEFSNSIKYFKRMQNNLNLSPNHQTDIKSLIRMYRDIYRFSDVANAVEDIVDSVVILKENKPFDLVIDDLVPKEVSLKLDKYFKSFIKYNNIPKSIYAICEQWYVDGIMIIYVKKDEEKKKIDFIVLDSLNVDMVNVNNKMSYKTKLYNPDTGNNDTIVLDENNSIILDSGKYLNGTTIGYLFKAIKPANTLNWLKDAFLIYRLARSPQRLAFFIDAGKVSKDKQTQILQEVMDEYNNDFSFDSNTGKIDYDKSVMSIMDNYYMIRQENRNTEIQEIGGNMDLGEINDYKQFKSDLLESLNSSPSRFSAEETDSMPTTATEYLVKERRYYKFITKLQNTYKNIFEEMYKHYVVFNNFMSKNIFEQYQNYIHFKMFSDSAIETNIRNAELSEAIRMFDALKPYTKRADGNNPDNVPVFSKKELIKKLFNRSDADMKKAIEEIIAEENNPNYNKDVVVQQPQDNQTDSGMGGMDMGMDNMGGMGMDDMQQDNNTDFLEPAGNEEDMNIDF